jgi:hypothetical protein
VIKTAQVSADGLYRHRLDRIWDEQLAIVNFIMLNPSTADADKDDATIRKCVQFAKRWGHGGIIVTNLFAWRATNPEELEKLPNMSRGAGAQNDHVIASIAEMAHVIVCAWGNHGKITGAGSSGTFQPRGREVIDGLRQNGYAKKLHHLELNKSGEPKHPLYCLGSLEPIPYG